MEDTEMREGEKKIFQTGLFDNLTVQDAYIIILLAAAYTDLEDGKEEWDKAIINIVGKNELFEEDQSHTMDRINKFSISMKEVNPLNAVERAAKVLTPELRQKSFMLAAQIAKATHETRTTKILESLASKLAIEKQIIENIKDSTLKKS